MNASLLTFSITGIGILVQVFTRKRHLLASLLSSTFAFLIAIFIFSIPMDRAFTLMGASIRVSSTWQIFGRSLVLDEFNRQAVGYLYLIGGAILGSAWISKPTRMFHPLGLAILALVAASLMVVPFLFAAIFLELAAITFLLVLSTRTIGTARSGLRMLILYTLAMLAILFAGSMIELSGMSDLGVILLDTRVSILLAFGFAILLSIPPFHAWLPMAAGETHPFAIALASTVLPAAGLFFVLRFFGALSLAANESNLLEIIRIFGATTVWVAAFWGASQKSFAKMAAYATVSDLGVMLIAVGLGSEQGFRLALAITAARFVGSLCLAIGLANNSDKHRINRQEGEPIDAALPQNTAARLVTFLGAASIAGLPLTAGFPAKWRLLQILATGTAYAWISIMVAMFIFGLRILRFAQKNRSNGRGNGGAHTDAKIIVFLYAAVFLTFAFGLVPQVLNRWIEHTVMGLGLLIP